MEYELGLQAKKTLPKPVVFQELSEDYAVRPGTSFDNNRALKSKFLAQKLKNLN
jgi:hypothetical protein